MVFCSFIFVCVLEEEFELFQPNLTDDQISLGEYNHHFTFYTDVRVQSIIKISFKRRKKQINSKTKSWEVSKQTKVQFILRRSETAANQTFLMRFGDTNCEAVGRSHTTICLRIQVRSEMVDLQDRWSSKNIKNVIAC